MKGSKLEPCDLVSARVRKSSNVWETFEAPMFEIQGIPEDEENITESEEDLKTVKTLRTGCMRYFGIFCALMSSIIFSLGSVIVKSLSSYHAFNVSTWRFQGVLLPNILILIYYWIKGRSDTLFKSVWPISRPGAKMNLMTLFFRGFIAGASVVSQVYSIQYLNLADSTVIVFSTPVVVTIMAHFILRETLGVVPIIASIITLGGVVIIARPPVLTGGESLTVDQLIGIGMAIVAMLTSAAIMIILRFLKDVSTTLSTTSFGGVGTLFCVILALSTGLFEIPQGRDDWIIAIALGFLTFIGQIFFTLAFQNEEAGLVALIRTFDVCFAFIWQFIFLGIQPDMFSIIGAVIVISGVLVIGIRKMIEGLPDGNNTRRRFRYLLL